MDRWHLRTPVSSLNEIERKESLGTSLGEVRISLREPPWASLVAQLVLPAMWETWVWSLGREDPLGGEKGRATHSSILAWRTPWTVCGRKESDTTEWLFCFTLGEVGGGDESVHLRRLEPSWSLLVNWAQLQASSRHLFLSTVSTVGQELENFRPVSLIWPATCFCKELFIWIQSCLPVYVSSSGAFTTWAKDCLVAELEIFTSQPFLAKVCHLCSEVWTSLCAGSRVVSLWKFQLRKDREHRPKGTRPCPLPLTLLDS